MSSAVGLMSSSPTEGVRPNPSASYTPRAAVFVAFTRNVTVRTRCVRAQSTAADTRSLAESVAPRARLEPQRVQVDGVGMLALGPDQPDRAVVDERGELGVGAQPPSPLRSGEGRLLADTGDREGRGCREAPAGAVPRTRANPTRSVG